MIPGSCKASLHWARGTTQKTTWLRENPSQNSRWHLCHDQCGGWSLRLPGLWKWVEADELERINLVTIVVEMGGAHCGNLERETKGPDVAIRCPFAEVRWLMQPQGVLLPSVYGGSPPTASLSAKLLQPRNPPPWIGIYVLKLERPFNQRRRRWAPSGARSINTG